MREAGRPCAVGRTDHETGWNSEARAMTGKRGRPPVPYDVAEAAMRLHDLGVPWSDIEHQVGISRRTAVRKASHEDHGQKSRDGER
jgi:hypothetical protein